MSPISDRLHFPCKRDRNVRWVHRCLACMLMETLDKAAVSPEVDNYRVKSVEADRCGWDLTATKGDEEIHVEVVGVAGSLVRLFLKASECKSALCDPKWMLVVVTDAFGEPDWYELDGPTAMAHLIPSPRPHALFTG